MGVLSRLPQPSPGRHTRLHAQGVAKGHATEKADAEALEREQALDGLENEIRGDDRFAKSLTTEDQFGVTGVGANARATGDIGGTFNNLFVRAGSMTALWFPLVDNKRVLPDVDVRLANFPERVLAGERRRALPDGVAVGIDDVHGGILAGRVVDGVFDGARIPNLPAGKTTTGVFGKERIPTVVNDMLGNQSVGLDKIHNSIKSAEADTESLRKIGLGSGPKAAGENHSHSTSYALRFEALPASVRGAMLAERDTLNSALAGTQGSEWTGSEKRAVMKLLALLLHVSLDGLTETALERQGRRGRSKGLDRYYRRKTFEMLKSEITEGTAIVEADTPKLSDMIGNPTPEWDSALPRFARAVPAELAP